MSRFDESDQRDGQDKRISESLKSGLDSRSPDPALMSDTYEKMSVRSGKSRERMPELKKRRLTAVLTACLFVFILAVPVGTAVRDAFIDPGYQMDKTVAVTSLKQIEDALDFGKGGSFLSFLGGDKAMPEAVNQADGTSGGSKEASKTNVQVEGMDEGDLVKTDGETGYIYYVCKDGFSIIGTGGGVPEEIAYEKLDNFYPVEMYFADTVTGKKVILIGNVYSEFSYKNVSGSDIGLDFGCCMPYYRSSSVKLIVFDVDAPGNIALDYEYTIDGYINTSRLQESSGILYLVTMYYPSKSQLLPKTSVSGGAATGIPLGSVSFFRNSIANSLMTLTAVNLNKLTGKPESRSYLNYFGTIYVSGQNLYAITSEYKTDYVNMIQGGFTHISKFSLASLKFVRNATVRGEIRDRYSVDEFGGKAVDGSAFDFDGYFRIATTYSYYKVRRNGLFIENVDYAMHRVCLMYVFDSELKPVRQRSDDKAFGYDKNAVMFKEGESIMSVRFSGLNGYVVTFLQRDPLFTFDFSDPRNVTVDEGLKEDGYSGYLHVVEEGKYMIGVGYGSDITGSTALTGLKVQLYDISGETAVPVGGKFYIDSAYAEIMYNPKALLYYNDNGKEVFGFSYDSYDYSYSDGAYKCMYTQGFVCLWYDGEGIEFKGELRHNGTIDFGAYYDYNNAYANSIQRGVLMGDHIFTLSPGKVCSYELSGISGGGVIEPYKELVFGQ